MVRAEHGGHRANNTTGSQTVEYKTLYPRDGEQHDLDQSGRGIVHRRRRRASPGNSVTPPGGQPNADASILGQSSPGKGATDHLLDVNQCTQCRSGTSVFDWWDSHRFAWRLTRERVHF